MSTLAVMWDVSTQPDDRADLMRGVWLGELTLPLLILLTGAKIPEKLLLGIKTK